MNKKISKNNQLLLSISAEQKERLANVAKRFGHTSISAFVGAIADETICVVSCDAYTLLEEIREKRAARKARYEAKKQKEEGQQ